MPGRKDLRHHADLVDRMATKLGVDLQSAAITGSISVDALGEAVLRCADCPNPAHCQGVLAEDHETDQPPEYCRNLDLLRRLATAAKDGA